MIEDLIRDLTSALRESNQLRREDLAFRRELFKAAHPGTPDATDTPEPATAEPEKPKRAPRKTAPLEVVEPAAAEETTPAPVEETPEPAEEPTPEPPASEEPPVTDADIREYLRPFLGAATGSDKTALQNKIKGVLAEFNAPSTKDLKPEQCAPCMARMKEVVG